MKESIQNFLQQLSFEPSVVNAEKIPANKKYFIVGGMGGSHLSAGLLKTFLPGSEIYIHRDYDLPSYDDNFMAESLCVASSYSGNTEETLDFAAMAYAKGLALVIITTGGELLEFAKTNGLPYILLPKDNIQPRMAIIYSLLALAKLVAPDFINVLKNTLSGLDLSGLEQAGADLANSIEHKIPVVYSARAHRSLAYMWKINFNETGKIPAFYNSFPELNHNEMEGIRGDFHILILRDEDNDSRIEKRMTVTETILQEKGLSVTSLYLEGESIIEKVFRSLVLSYWTAYHIAVNDGDEPEQVPTIENFKSKIK